MFYTLLTIVGLFISLLVYLVIVSPGKPSAFTDKNGNILKGSISEKIFVQIGGVKQGMFIQSKDSTNPVLLYLHGGIPDYFLTKKYPTVLENYFTVVWWDQRWAGLSYNSNRPKDSTTLEQMISDTKEVTNYHVSALGKTRFTSWDGQEEPLLPFIRQKRPLNYITLTLGLLRCRTT